MITRAQAKGSREVRLAYIDLFCGPGRYLDRTPSTPLRILQHAIKDPILRERLVLIFNDKNATYTKALEEEIHNTPGIDSLRHKPVVITSEVNDRLAEILQKQRNVPALLFADPWGYKGLSRNLIRSIIKD